MNVKLLFSVLLAGLLLFGCTQPQTQPPAASVAATVQATSQASAPAATQEAATPLQPPATPSQSQASIQEVTLSATSFEFSPATVTVKKGVPVKLTITAQDVPHGFSLPEFGIQRDLNPGKAEVIEFTPDKAGSFTFACSVFCGAGHGGMKGTLVVTE